jgi:hypothetical protein
MRRINYNDIVRLTRNENFSDIWISAKHGVIAVNVKGGKIHLHQFKSPSKKNYKVVIDNIVRRLGGKEKLERNKPVMLAVDGCRFVATLNKGGSANLRMFRTRNINLNEITG